MLLAVLTSEMFGNDDFSGLTDQFVTAVTKEPFRLRIDQDDLASRIDDDNGVGEPPGAAPNNASR